MQVAVPGKQQHAPPTRQVLPLQRAAAAAFLLLARQLRAHTTQLRSLRLAVHENILLNCTCTYWSRLVGVVGVCCMCVCAR